MQKQKMFWHRVRNILIVLAMMNILLIWNRVPIGMGMMVPVTILLVLGCIYCNIRPVHVTLSGRRLKIMDAGYELIVTAGVSIVLEIVLVTVLFLCPIGTFSLKISILNGIVAFLVEALVILNGCTRVMFTSRDLGVTNRLLLLCLWWFPLVNVWILARWCKKVRYEFLYEQSQAMLDEARKENEVCKTCYPLVLVHGIFFRDWLYVNYWGRITGELKRNGAQVWYGHQQSSDAVRRSGQELKDNI